MAMFLPKPRPPGASPSAAQSDDASSVSAEAGRCPRGHGQRWVVFADVADVAKKHLNDDDTCAIIF